MTKTKRANFNSMLYVVAKVAVDATRKEFEGLDFIMVRMISPSVEHAKESIRNTFGAEPEIIRSCPQKEGMVSFRLASEALFSNLN